MKWLHSILLTCVSVCAWLLHLSIRLKYTQAWRAVCHLPIVSSVRIALTRALTNSIAAVLGIDSTVVNATLGFIGWCWMSVKILTQENTTKIVLGSDFCG